MLILLILILLLSGGGSYWYTRRPAYTGGMAPDWVYILLVACILYLVLHAAGVL